MCVGVLYTIFTGMSPQKTSLRPQPSSRRAVEARYTDIDSLDFSMEPSLSEGIAELLQRGSGEHIESAQEFINGLQRAATQHGWQFPDYYTSFASSDARLQMRTGLQRLREATRTSRSARPLPRGADTGWHQPRPGRRAAALGRHAERDAESPGCALGCRPDDATRIRQQMGASPFRREADRSSAFLDVCRLVGVEMPADGKTEAGEVFVFEPTLKLSSGHGFADVYYENHFAIEYKTADKYRDLEAAYEQLLKYRENLKNPPLLVVTDFNHWEIHTNFSKTEKNAFTSSTIVKSPATPKNLLGFATCLTIRTV